jgi:hypothetical protein
MTAYIDPLDLAVSSVLRSKQASLKISNVSLAAETNIHPRTLIRILEGHRPATVGELRLLASALRTTASQVAVEAERIVEDA